MGGSSKSSNPSSEKSDKNDFPGGVDGPTFTMQPAMPGQLEAVAQQLGLAYGQDPAGLLTHMGALYQPMVLPDYAPNRTAEQGANPAPSGSEAPSSSSAGLLGGYSDYGFMHAAPGIGVAVGGGGPYASNPYYFPGWR